MGTCDRIELREVVGDEGGIVSGRDQEGRVWVRQEVCVFGEEESNLDCPVCHEPLRVGWLLLDGSGTQLCDRHVTVVL
jgi:hypothetical protein